jgi:hypothetical protein
MFSERKLALRFRRPTTWYGFASVTTIVALAVVVSLLTWWNDLYKPIVHPIEAIKGIQPEKVLEQVDEQVATLLGVDEETVRTARKGLAEASSGIPQLGGKLYEVATKQPASADWAASTPTIFPTRNTVAPAPEDPSPTPNEPPLMRNDPPLPSTDTSPPAPSEPPPSTTDTLPPAGGEPQPPTADQPPPVTDSPPPPVSQPPTTTSPPPTDQPPPPTNQPPPTADQPPSQLPPSQPPLTSNQPPSTPTS